jgi:hypothetical protein
MGWQRDELAGVSLAGGKQRLRFVPIKQIVINLSVIEDVIIGKFRIRRRPRVRGKRENCQEPIG